MIAAGATFALAYGLWMALVMRLGLLADYKYL
jgi:predicted tellurium resistance membrane protein TerC